MGGPRKGLVERVKDILLTPKTEWNVIDAEPATIGSIYTSYVVILAAIGPICMIIGQQVFGYSLMGVSWKPPIALSIGQAVISYVMSLVSVYVSALIIDALAPSFGGTKNQVKAFKVAAYSATAAWLAGIFQIIPMLAILGIVGLYSLYLLYLGLPRLMRVSDDKAIGYTVVVIVVQIVLYFVVAMVVAALVGAFFGSMMMGAAGGVTIR
ncbi:MAG: YIP1 family protein [Sphingomonadaceae bacterium]|nr:YIP1 family protein [Sphingomonadaceae bacterium]